MSPKLSAVIIALNEESDLPGCLESIAKLCDEIVIVDSGSIDRTLEIARSYTPNVFKHPFENYAAQKQNALERASGEWVLSIDADERVSPELAREIPRVIQSADAAAGFDIPFAVHFMGRRLRFGGLGCEHHLRLFRRRAGRFAGGRLHEGIELEGQTERLEGVIAHHPYRDLDDYLGKLGVYTTQAARKRYEAGRRFSVLHHALPFWEFFHRTVLRLGALDGTPGIVWAGLSAFHTWLKYVKLRELEGSA